MTTANIGGFSLNGLFDEDEQYTFSISGTVVAGDVGKAVTLDTSKNNTVKLAGDNEVIIGRLETLELRLTEGIQSCTVSIGGGMKFLVNPDAVASPGDEIPGVGSYLTGAQDDSSTPVKGYVQKMASGSAEPKRWVVVEDKVVDGYVIAIEL